MNAKRHVLVIDDDAVVGRSFNRVLSDKGYEVDTARNGEEALKDIEAQLKTTPINKGLARNLDVLRSHE